MEQENTVWVESCDTRSRLHLYAALAVPFYLENLPTITGSLLRLYL